MTFLSCLHKSSSPHGLPSRPVLQPFTFRSPFPIFLLPLFPFPPLHSSSLLFPYFCYERPKQGPPGRVRCQRGPHPACPSPDSLLPISEELLGGAGGRKDGCRHNPAACAMGRKGGGHGEGPISYRGLSLRHAVAGLPSALQWLPSVVAGSGTASGPLVSTFSGSSKSSMSRLHLHTAPCGTAPPS